MTRKQQTSAIDKKNLRKKRTIHSSRRFKILLLLSSNKLRSHGVEKERDEEEIEETLDIKDVERL